MLPSRNTEAILTLFRLRPHSGLLLIPCIAAFFLFKPFWGFNAQLQSTAPLFPFHGWFPHFAQVLTTHSDTISTPTPNTLMRTTPIGALILELGCPFLHRIDAAMLHPTSRLKYSRSMESIQGSIEGRMNYLDTNLFIQLG